MASAGGEEADCIRNSKETRVKFDPNRNKNFPKNVLVTRRRNHV